MLDGGHTITLKDLTPADVIERLRKAGNYVQFPNGIVIDPRRVVAVIALPRREGLSAPPASKTEAA